MINSFTGIGRLENNPEVSRSEENAVVSSAFVLIIPEFYKQDGNLNKRTHRIPCVALERMAEIVGEFLKKGSHVGIRGVLRMDEDEGKKLKVHITELDFLSSGANSASV